MFLFESAWLNGSSQHHLVMTFLSSVAERLSVVNFFFLLVVDLFTVPHFLAMKTGWHFKTLQVFIAVKLLGNKWYPRR